MLGRRVGLRRPDLGRGAGCRARSARRRPRRAPPVAGQGPARSARRALARRVSCCAPRPAVEGTFGPVRRDSARAELQTHTALRTCFARRHQDMGTSRTDNSGINDAARLLERAQEAVNRGDPVRMLEALTARRYSGRPQASAASVVRRQSFDGRSFHVDADRHPDVAAPRERSQAVSDTVDAGTLHEGNGGSECRPYRVLQPKTEDVSETVAVRLQEQGRHGVQSVPDAEERRAVARSATTCPGEPIGRRLRGRRCP